MLKYSNCMSRPAANATVYHAIADPTRRAILDLLARDGEQPVTHLSRQFAVTLSAISQHMRVLREADLVRMRPVGRERWYRLNADPLREVAHWAGNYKRFWHDRLAALGEHLDNENETP